MGTLYPTTVRCPRCGRTGHVSRDLADAFIVDWVARHASAQWAAWGPSRDRGVTLDDLTRTAPKATFPDDPTFGLFGCGYDWPASEAAEAHRLQSGALR